MLYVCAGVSVLAFTGICVGVVGGVGWIWGGGGGGNGWGGIYEILAQVMCGLMYTGKSLAVGLLFF